MCRAGAVIVAESSIAVRSRQYSSRAGCNSTSSIHGRTFASIGCSATGVDHIASELDIIAASAMMSAGSPCPSAKSRRSMLIDCCVVQLIRVSRDSAPPGEYKGAR
jgi:hypothetical protein